MQVNNNVQSPNFGMAMIIHTPWPDLAKLDKAVLKNLQKWGEEMVNNKYADMVINGPDAKPVLRINNDKIEHGKIIEISEPKAETDAQCPYRLNLVGRRVDNGTNNGDLVSFLLRMESPESVKKLVNLKAANEYDQVAAFVDEFEKRGQMLQKEADEEAALQAEKNELAKDLAWRYNPLNA